MTNEEFQKLVLEKLDRLETGQVRLEEGQVRLEDNQIKLEEGQVRLEDNQIKLEEGQVRLESRQGELEGGQREILLKLDAVIEQTADLTEFRYEVKSELAEIKNNLSRIEIATADNWGDIARLKSVR